MEIIGKTYKCIKSLQEGWLFTKGKNYTVECNRMHGTFMTTDDGRIHIYCIGYGDIQTTLFGGFDMREYLIEISEYERESKLQNEVDRLRRFKEYWDELYGKGLEVANWHMNGKLEDFDNFYDSAMDEYDKEI